MVGKKTVRNISTTSGKTCRPCQSSVKRRPAEERKRPAEIMRSSRQKPHINLISKGSEKLERYREEVVIREEPDRLSIKGRTETKNVAKSIKRAPHSEPQSEGSCGLEYTAKNLNNNH